MTASTPEEQARVAAWTDRALGAIKDDRQEWRAETMWRTFAPNGLDLLIGEHIADLGGTRAALSSTVPDEWLAVADLIDRLLEQEPLSKAARYAGQRIILGTFAAELRSYVGAAERTHEA